MQRNNLGMILTWPTMARININTIRQSHLFPVLPRRRAHAGTIVRIYPDILARWCGITTAGIVFDLMDRPVWLVVISIFAIVNLDHCLLQIIQPASSSPQTTWRDQLRFGHSETHGVSRHLAHFSLHRSLGEAQVGCSSSPGRGCIACWRGDCSGLH